MKQIFQSTLMLVIVFLAGQQVYAQTNWNIGGGYFAESTISPGIVIELEKEKFHSNLVSIPIQLDAIGFNNPDYSGLNFEIKTGYRKYFNNGVFFEQSIGLGYQFLKYKPDMWYMDKYNFSIPHGNKITPWSIVSANVGLGYNLSKKKEFNRLIWIRPKLTWLPGLRGIHLPYHAFQIGYTHNIKSK